ncbi:MULTISPECIES: terminase small subunit [Clostridium]|uniref:Terminase small subunit n=1 Tax=Clostridium frigoriphilum TaxID=443253 RepID=A0ABU7UU22_9CLOT|nr:terminase small subunit [Clostridium sp. DSM 17811]MBU3098734.1 terminase small subunit [Clostridium sp. DSM 17811]
MATRILKDKITKKVTTKSKGNSKEKVIKKDVEYLNDNMKNFCVEYLIDLNGSASYIRAYGEHIEPESAKVMASKLLTNVHVKAYINALLDSYTDNVGLTVGELVNNIKSIAFNEKARHSDRIKASQLLAQYMGLLVEHKDVTSNGSTINVTLED